MLAPSLIFINHGDDEAGQALQEKITGELGLQAIAPFSGTAFDLAAGQMTVYTEGRKVELKGHARTVEVYETLIQAAQELTIRNNNQQMEQIHLNLLRHRLVHKQ